jgi:hypothetical protein
MKKLTDTTTFRTFAFSRQTFFTRSVIINELLMMEYDVDSAETVSETSEKFHVGLL